MFLLISGIITGFILALVISHPFLEYSDRETERKLEQIFTNLQNIQKRMNR